MLRIYAGLLASLFCVFYSAVAVIGQTESLGKELAKLEALRKGAKTPLGEVDARCVELLARFPTPKEQGQI